VLWGGTMPLLYAIPRRAIMSMVPVEKHGQASGINMTAQLLGGTMGMAIASALFLVTRDFSVLLFTATGLCVAVMVVTAVASEHEVNARTHSSGL